mgnify:CR=1 FL=1
MRILTSVFSILALTFALGCSGGDDDDGGGETADANTSGTADAAVSTGPDAMPQGSSNLGATCNQETPCEAPAAACLASQGAPSGFCSLTCGSGVTITSTAEGQIPIPADPALHALCSADYSGVGTPACSLIVGGNLPAPPQQPAPNTEYMVDLACGIACEMTTNACPSNLTCSQGLCLP